EDQTILLVSQKFVSPTTPHSPYEFCRATCGHLYYWTPQTSFEGLSENCSARLRVYFVSALAVAHAARTAPSERRNEEAAPLCARNNLPKLADHGSPPARNTKLHR